MQENGQNRAWTKYDFKNNCEEQKKREEPKIKDWSADSDRLVNELRLMRGVSLRSGVNDLTEIFVPSFAF